MSSEQGREAVIELKEMLSDNDNVTAVYYEDDFLVVQLFKPKGSIEGIHSGYRNFPIILRDQRGKQIAQALPPDPDEQTIEELRAGLHSKPFVPADLPERFTERRNEKGNGVIITDSETGNEIEVGLFEVGGAYRAMRAFCA